MFANLQGSDRLWSMLLVAADDDNHVNVRIAKNFFEVRRTVLSAEPQSIALAANPACRIDRPQVGALNLFQHRQMHPPCEIPRSYQCDSNLLSGCARSPDLY